MLRQEIANSCFPIVGASVGLVRAGMITADTIATE